MQTVKIDLANFEIIKPDIRVQKMRHKVPDDETIDTDKIVKDDAPRYKPNEELKDTLHARKAATEAKNLEKTKDYKMKKLDKYK